MTVTLKRLARDSPAILLAALVEAWLVSSFGSATAERPLIRIEADVVQFLVPSAPAPAPVQVPSQGDFKIPETGTVRTRSCVDAAGREGGFQAIVFLDSYNWVFKSTDRVEFNGRPTDFQAVLGQEPLQQIYRLSRQIIAVGTASCEASRLPWGPLREEQRADERARTLVRWIQEARRQPTEDPQAPMRSVVPLSLGRFRGECSASASSATWNQRRIVLIAVTEMADGLDLESCLKRSMQDDRSLEFLTENYSRFALDADFKMPAP